MPVEANLPSNDPEAMPPHYRRNFALFLTDYICFGVALAFANLNSVTPAFVGQLTDSAPVIGLANTVFSGGWLLPQLVVARLVHDKPRKRPYMLAGLSGRALFWIIALALWAGLARYPTATLVLFFACLGLFAFSDGVSSVAWFDILARAVPPRRRARLFGLGQVISGLAGVGIGILVKMIVDRRPFPGNYALIFALAGTALAISTVALVLVREPPAEDTGPQTDRGTGIGLTRPLADPALRRLIICRLLIGLMGLATPFYIVHAAKVLHLPQSIIGDFVTAETLAKVIAGAAMSLIGERWGSHYVIRIGSAVAVTGPLFALAAHLTGSGWLIRAYPFVSVTLGVMNSAYMLGFFNYLLEIAPERTRPAYIGLSNTILGVLTLAPMAGGWLLEATSYTTLFGVTAAIVAIGFLFTLGLKPPQQAIPAEAQS
jgi:MFS family permease